MNQSASNFFATLGILIILAAPCLSIAAESPPAPTEIQRAISGRWYTESHEGGVEIYPCGDDVCGKFSWLRDDMDNGAISRDDHNPDPAQRQRPLCHMQFMGSFTPEGKNRYIEGWIYNPRDGGVYSAQMTLVDNDTLDLHGYLFFPFLGQSQIWKRAKTMPACMGE